MFYWKSVLFFCSHLGKVYFCCQWPVFFFFSSTWIDSSQISTTSVRMYFGYWTNNHWKQYYLILIYLTSKVCSMHFNLFFSSLSGTDIKTKYTRDWLTFSFRLCPSQFVLFRGVRCTHACNLKYTGLLLHRDFLFFSFQTCTCVDSDMKEAQSTDECNIDGLLPWVFPQWLPFGAELGVILMENTYCLFFDFLL